MKNILGILLFSMLMLSCGQKSSVWPTHDVEAANTDPATSEDFTYELSGFRCTTGPQAAATFTEICTTLKDDEINQSCAQAKREELFANSECPGSFINWIL